MKFKPKTREVYRKAYVYEEFWCDKCGQSMPNMFDDIGEGNSDYQPKDGLIIHLDGGYGMYFDSPLLPRATLVFCKKCASGLIDNPEYQCFIEAISEVENS